MTDHPLTEERAAEMWDEHHTPAHPILRWALAHETEREATLALLRAAFDAGREHECTNPDDARDPLTLAREVLETAHEDETVTVCSVPDNKAAALARAVIELDAELDAYREDNTRHREGRARMEALADQYDAEARLERREGDVSESINTQATADRIRAALNGDNHD